MIIQIYNKAILDIFYHMYLNGRVRMRNLTIGG
jgi:hypothetical protein